MVPMRQGSEARRRIRTRVYIDGYSLYYGCLKLSADESLGQRLWNCVKSGVGTHGGVYRNGALIRHSGN